MHRYKFKLKHGAWVVLEAYLWAAAVYVTWGILAPIALWRLASAFLARVTIVPEDEAKITVES